jgi:hypothetical protein
VFDRFTEEARQVVVVAQQEARDLRHSGIDTEHLLLGVLADRRSGASRVLKGFGITQKSVRDQVVLILGRGDAPVEGFMPFTAAAKKVLELALRESLSSGSRVVTPEHLLRALMRVDEGVAVRVLCDLNADPREISETLMPLLPIPNPLGPPTPRAFAPRPVIVRSDSILSRVVEECVGRALDEDRSEYGLADLLDAIINDPEAAAAVESLGLDLQPLRELDVPDALGGAA